MPIDADFVKEIEAAAEEFVEAKNEEKNENTDNDSSKSEDSGETESNDGKPASEGNRSPESSGENAEIQDDENEPAGGSEGDDDKAEIKPPVIEIKPPVIGDYAVTQAIHAGFSEEEARAFGSEKALARAVEMLQEARESQKPSSEEKVKDPLDDLPELDPEVYGEEAIKVLTTMKEQLKAQKELLDSYRESNQRAMQLQENAAAREIEQWFDKSIESLGKDFEDALGKGGYNSLSRGSSQFAKRDEIANQMAIMIAGYQARGFEPPPRDEVFKAVSKMVLADEYQAIREKQVSAKLQKRSTQHINRAGGSKGGTGKGTDPVAETAALLNEKYFS